MDMMFVRSVTVTQSSCFAETSIIQAIYRLSALLSYQPASAIAHAFRAEELNPTYHPKDTEEEVEEIEIERQCTQDSLIHAQPFHNLLRVVQDKAREQENRKAGDEQIDVGVERQEDLDERCRQKSHEGRKEEWAEERKVKLGMISSCSFYRAERQAYLGLEGEEGETSKDADSDEERL